MLEKRTGGGQESRVIPIIMKWRSKANDFEILCSWHVAKLVQSVNDLVVVDRSIGSFGSARSNQLIQKGITLFQLILLDNFNWGKTSEYRALLLDSTKGSY